MLGRITCRRINTYVITFITLAILLLHSSYNLFAADASGRARVLVKLRHPLSDDMETALPLQTMAIVSGKGASPRVQAFFARHKPQRVSPLYTSVVRAKKVRGISDRQFANLVQL